MTIDEAIEILKRTVTETPYGNPDIKEATQLGIEALEAYQELRQCTAIDVEDIKPLPSESKP